jgi:hypothetical protein
MKNVLDKKRTAFFSSGGRSDSSARGGLPFLSLGCFTRESRVRCAHYSLFPLTGFANKFAAAKRKKPSDL